MDFQTTRTQGLSSITDLMNKVRAFGDSKFEKLLETHINIPKDLRSEASTSQTYIRKNLNQQHSNDSKFPRIMAYNDSDFIGGSFGRHTKIKPLDDIDVYFPIDGETLIFKHDGVNYGVGGDGILLITNPILGPKWTKPDGNVSSLKLIAGFCETLKTWYPNSIVKKNGQAVTVRLKTVAVETESDPGLGFDIVPCFLVRNHNPGQPNFYVIPDGNDGWIRTNPRIDKEINDALHEHHNKYFRPVVKLLKFWNAEYFESKVSSYYIELALMRHFRTKSQKMSSIQEGLAEAFRVIGNALLLEENLSPWIEKAPQVTPGELSKLDRYEFYTKSLEAKEAHELFKKSRLNDSNIKWKNLIPDLVV